MDVTQIRNFPNLTPRQLEVMRLIAYPYTRGEICEMLNISYKTLDTHIRFIFAKTGFNKLSQIVRYVREQNEKNQSPHRITEALNPSMLITQKPKSDIQ